MFYLGFHMAHEANGVFLSLGVVFYLVNQTGPYPSVCVSFDQIILSLLLAEVKHSQRELLLHLYLGNIPNGTLFFQLLLVFVSLELFLSLLSSNR